MHTDVTDGEIDGLIDGLIEGEIGSRAGCCLPGFPQGALVDPERPADALWRSAGPGRELR